MTPAPSTDRKPRGPVQAPRKSSRATHTTGKQTFGRAVHAEWIKFRSLRSTWVTSFIAAAITVAIGALLSIAMVDTDDPERMESAKWVVGEGAVFGQIAVAVLGALFATGEYSSGQIRSSLAAVPRRGRLLTAKAIIVALHAFALGALSILATWALSAPFMDGHAGSLTDAKFFGQFWGTGLSFAGIALMALGLGFLLRSTAGAVTTIMTLLFVIDIPLLLLTRKWDWFTKIRGLEPSIVAKAVSDPLDKSAWSLEGTPTYLEHWQAVAVFCAWAVIPLVVGWVVLTRRDA